MPREIEPSWEDGMRSVRRSEMDSLVKLIDEVFFPGLTKIQPHIFNDENLSNVRVVVEDGEVVSHIGTIRRNVSIHGCPAKVASLGGVATYASHRGKGFAGALLQDTMRVCREDGVDYIMVSGYRNMYHRAGCRTVGRDWVFAVDAERASDFDDADLSVEVATEADVETLGAIYRCEPVRWMRPPSDFGFCIDGWVQNRPARTFLIKRGESVQAFAVVQTVREKDDGRVAVLDYAGDRSALVGVLGKLIVDQTSTAEQSLNRLSIHAKGFDTVLQGLLAARGLTGSQANVPGTTLIIHFEKFMEKLRPYFAERVGETAANGLVFREVDDEYHVYYGGDRVVAESRGAAAQLIFGTWDGVEEEMLELGGQAGDVLRACLPIPGLWYGVNYV
ncbi:MAG: GNAT family N-acetyltransferase [Candidatus Latescibacteria bacterium]|nr:GNAT family N-acetyltransferase [Candidatus Latescibacterota bacterium]